MNLPGRPEPDHASDAASPAATGPAHRRRLDEIFGDVLPDVTTDERDTTRAADRAADDDRWFLDNRPPHHD